MPRSAAASAPTKQEETTIDRPAPSPSPPIAGRAVGRRLVLVGAVAAVALVMAGCSKPSVPTSFLAQTPDRLFFLEWSSRGTSVSGTLLLSSTDTSSTPPTVSTQAGTFRGSLTQGKVALDFTRDVGLGSTWTGTLAGSTLTLSYQGSDGRTGTVRFAAASIDAYNSALAARRSSAQSAGQTASDQAGQSAAQEVLDKDASRVNADLSALDKDTAALEADAAPLDGLMAQLAANVALAKSENSKAQHNRSKSVICAASASASSAAGAAGAESAAVSDQADKMKADIDAISADSAKLSTDWGRLQQDLRLYPAYRPSSMPSQADIDDALASAATSSTTNAKTRDADLASSASKAKAASSFASEAAGACASA